MQLDIAEAVNAAYVGSQAGKTNQSSYRNWLRNVEASILRLSGERVPTAWDVMPKSRKFGR